MTQDHSIWTSIGTAAAGIVSGALVVWRMVSRERVASARDGAETARASTDQAKAEAEQTTVELLTEQLRQAIAHARQLSDDAEKARAGRGELVDQLAELRAEVGRLTAQVHQQNLLLIALVKIVGDKAALKALEPALYAVGIDVSEHTEIRQ